jgi:uncharacterized membrane protein YdjX (TVP38/TMEM64 family)
MWRARRAVILAVLVALALSLLLSSPVHARMLVLFTQAEGVIRQHPVLGIGVFVLLAIVSAMLMFVSSVVLIPVAIYVWGPLVCALLLWAGWFLGGMLSYAIGRYLGRPVVDRMVRAETLARYEAYARKASAFVPIVLLQLAIPSDTAGYLFGMVRVPLRLYLVALALAEIPYAIGAVYLGTSFLERRIVPLVLLGVAGIGLSLLAYRSVHRGEAGARAG